MQWEVTIRNGNAHDPARVYSIDAPDIIAAVVIARTQAVHEQFAPLYPYATALRAVAVKP